MRNRNFRPRPCARSLQPIAALHSRRPEIHRLRPRIVVHVSRDGSFDFAASCDVEIVIVRAGSREFLAHPNVDIGIGPVRRLLEGAVGPRLRPAWAAGAESAA